MKLFDYANQYIEESDWKIFAILKFCLVALGILIGLLIGEKGCEKGKKAVAICSGVVFVVTYVVLMTKFFKLVFRK
ncbi:MAG: permease of phosphate ABC transporter [Oscillospiraceae bacterium]|nr:permease of phosphate ABC transporter [Oscillospiraceae bacterium]